MVLLLEYNIFVLFPPLRGRIHVWDYPKGNQDIRTHSPVQGLTGDPDELATVLGLVSVCQYWAWCNPPPSLTAGGAWRNSTRVCRPGNWTGGEKGARFPGDGEWCSKRDAGQFFPPITCYPTHGKRLAERGDCRILQRCSVSPSPQLCRCPQKRPRAATHWRRQNSEWSEPSRPGGMLTLRMVRQGNGIHYPVGQPLIGVGMQRLTGFTINRALKRHG